MIRPILQVSVGLLVGGFISAGFCWGISITDRHLFYAESAFLDPSSDVSPLLPGQTSTGVNISNYANGLTGIMVDFVDGNLSEANFQFRVGNTSDIGNWISGPDPSSFSVQTGAGVEESDRVTISWSEQAIVNSWLQVTISNSGLPVEDVFFFGNLAGDTNRDGAVTAIDAMLIVNDLNNNGIHAASIDDSHDINKDGSVSPIDLAIVIDLLNGGDSLGPFSWCMDNGVSLVAYDDAPLDSPFGPTVPAYPIVVGAPSLALSLAPSPVPEPSTVLLLGAGLGGLVLYWRRQRNKS